MLVLGIIIFITAVVLRAAASIKAPEGTEVATIKNPLFASALVCFTLGLGLIGVSFTNWVDSVKGDRPDKSLDKYTYNDWKQYADADMAHWWDCAKDYNDLADMQVCTEANARNWTYFRDAIDKYANLSYEQVQELKDYWNRTQEAMGAKIIKQIEENAQRAYPNRYK